MLATRLIKPIMILSSLLAIFEFFHLGFVNSEEKRKIEPVQSYKMVDRDIENIYQIYAKTDGLGREIDSSLGVSLVRSHAAKSMVSEASDSNNYELIELPRIEALGVSVGTYQFGYYSVYNAKTNSFNGCSSWALCGEKLFGVNIAVDYVRRIKDVGDLSVDLDAQLSFGYQSLSQSWYKPIEADKRESYFALLSLVPMARMQLPGSFDKFSIGAGVGASLALGRIPYEYPYNIPLMVAINGEVAYKLSEIKREEVYFSLRHRCAAFGILNGVDDSQVGSQWYQVGFRKWF